MLSKLIGYFYPKVISADNVSVKIPDPVQYIQEEINNEEETDNQEETNNNEVCNHNFIDYDILLLDRISNEIESRRLNQLNRVIDKRTELNELDTKILDLIVKWYPASPMVHGKCMCCSKSVIVCRSMNKDIIYV